MYKFNTPRGHGFAAERANHIYDKVTGKDAKIIGDDNALNGADRLVDGVTDPSEAKNIIRKGNFPIFMGRFY